MAYYYRGARVNAKCTLTRRVMSSSTSSYSSLNLFRYLSSCVGRELPFDCLEAEIAPYFIIETRFTLLLLVITPLGW